MSGGGSADSRPSRSWIWGEPLLVWLILLGLFALNAGMAHVLSGKTVALFTVSVAVTQVALIGTFFMRLMRSPGTLWLAALAGAVFLFTAFLLTFGDYATRPNW